MKEILDIMDDKMKRGIIQLQIFLAASGAKPIFHFMATIQAIFFDTNFLVAHE